MAARPPAAHEEHADDYATPRRRPRGRARAGGRAPARGRATPRGDLAAHRRPHLITHLRVVAGPRLPLVLRRDARPERDDEHADARARLPRVRTDRVLRGARNHGAVPVRGDARLLPLRGRAGRPALQAARGSGRPDRIRRDVGCGGGAALCGSAALRAPADRGDGAGSHRRTDLPGAAIDAGGDRRAVPLAERNRAQHGRHEHHAAVRTDARRGHARDRRRGVGLRAHDRAVPALRRPAPAGTEAGAGPGSGGYPRRDRGVARGTRLHPPDAHDVPAARPQLRDLVPRDAVHPPPAGVRRRRARWGRGAARSHDERCGHRVTGRGARPGSAAAGAARKAACC